MQDLLYVLMCFFCCNMVYAIDVCKRQEQSYPATTTEWSDWMMNISPEIPISRMSIPGTHDSMTYLIAQGSGAGYIKTQHNERPFITQLDNGVRFLDWRLKVNQCASWVAKSLEFYHGTSHLENMPLSDAASWVHRWLEDHPTEFVLIRIKDEQDGGTPYPEDFARLVKEAFPSEWLYIPDDDLSDSEKFNPTMEMLRGKIVLIMDYPAHSAHLTPNIPWSKFRVFDLWNPLNAGECHNKSTCVQTKWNGAKGIWDGLSGSSDTSKINITFTSASTYNAAFPSVYVTPKEYADQINPSVHGAVGGVQPINRSVGIIVMDFFSGSELHDMISNRNTFQ